MKLGIDYDGTIVDTGVIKSQWIKSNLGIEVPYYQTDRSTCIKFIGEENYRSMKEVYERDLTLKALPVRNSLDSIKNLSENHELYLVTKRPLQTRLEYA